MNMPLEDTPERCLFVSWIIPELVYTDQGSALFRRMNTRFHQGSLTFTGCGTVTAWYLLLSSCSLQGPIHFLLGFYSTGRFGGGGLCIAHLHKLTGLLIVPGELPSTWGAACCPLSHLCVSRHWHCLFPILCCSVLPVGFTICFSEQTILLPYTAALFKPVTVYTLWKIPMTHDVWAWWWHLGCFALPLWMRLWGLHLLKVTT